MSLSNRRYQQKQAMATSPASVPPCLLTQVGMAGSAAVMTVTFVHPIDVVKTRIQISSEFGALGMSGTARRVATIEGVSALWNGINAAWMREASYTSLRLGLYEPVKITLGANDPTSSTFLKKFLAGSTAGAIGSLVGNPFDVLKTKMMASSRGETPCLSSTARKLFKNQGFSGFYRGIDSNIARAMVLNGTQMGVYEQSKDYVVATTGLSKTSIATQFLSSFCAGFFMTTSVAPLDMVRTRMMNQPADAKLYNNAADCFRKIAVQEGPATFWRGFFPIWSRFAPTTTLQLIIFEQLRGILGLKAL